MVVFRLHLSLCQPRPLHSFSLFFSFPITHSLHPLFHSAPVSVYISFSLPYLPSISISSCSSLICTILSISPFSPLSTYLPPIPHLYQLLHNCVAESHLSLTSVQCLSERLTKSGLGALSVKKFWPWCPINLPWCP